MTTGPTPPAGDTTASEKVRPILQTLARVIASDHRAVVLGSTGGEVLLANAAAQRLGLDAASLTTRFDWALLSRSAKRAGSTSAQLTVEDQQFEGELVHLPLGPGHAFLLRLSETDQEATWLRNRARAAALMRAAHDLRTPIQSMLASVDSLQNAQVTGTGDGLRQAAGQALDHINRVLAVLGGEDTVPSDEDFRIADEVRHIVALIQPIAAARATELILDIDAPQDLTLRGPLALVRALCQNMIDNSVNHGGGRVWLRLSGRRLHDDPLADNPEAQLFGVTIELRDEGGGIPQAQRDRLAAALGDLSGFRQAPVKGTRVSAGIEVLAHALRQLGGRLEIADRGPDGNALAPGSTDRIIGSVLTARFSLPCAPDLQPATPTTPAVASPLSGCRILLVEDSPASRDWLSHVLQGLGAYVTSAGSAPEALAMLSRPDLAESIQLVLTDVTLPRMNGIEFAQRLRDGDPAAPIRWHGIVVGLTAHVDQRVRAACHDAGMVRVLEKPIRPADLASALTEILAACDTGAAQPVVDADVAIHLAEQFGGDVARGFMLRALTEARGVIHALRHEGVSPDTGRQLHAATGASGLTGLRLVERCLRRIELALENDEPWSQLLTPTERAIDRTTRSIDRDTA